MRAAGGSTQADLASVRQAFESQEKAKEQQPAISRAIAGKKWCGLVCRNYKLASMILIAACHAAGRCSMPDTSRLPRFWLQAVQPPGRVAAAHI